MEDAAKYMAENGSQREWHTGAILQSTMVTIVE